MFNLKSIFIAKKFYKYKQKQFRYFQKWNTSKTKNGNDDFSENIF